LEELLAKAAKVSDEAEVFCVTSNETPVHFEANRLKHIQRKEEYFIALRLIKDGRLGYAVSTMEGRADELVEMALETSRFGQEALFELPLQTSMPQTDIYDANVGQVPLEKMVKLGRNMIEQVRAFNDDIICDASVRKTITTTSLVNSKGFNSVYKSSAFGFGIEGTLIRGTDMLFAGDSSVSSNLLTDSKSVINTTLKQFTYAKETASITTKTMPVIFTPFGVASAFMPALMAAFNGKLVLEGASPVGNKLGQQVFHQSLSLIDDPLVAFNPASSPFDDEGIPCRQTPLIKNGVISNFLYDLKTAAQAKRQSTGSGRRGGGSPPSPSPSCFVVGKGRTSFDEMVADVKEGLVVEYLMGAEQGNVLGGDFSGNVLLGYKIDNGKISGRVKNTMVSGNIYAILKDIIAIGSDSRRVDSSLTTPSIYCPTLSVASK
jgi:PmbA protein